MCNKETETRPGGLSQDATIPRLSRTQKMCTMKTGIMKHGMPFSLFLRAKTAKISGNRKVRHALHVEKAVFSRKGKQAMECYSKVLYLDFLQSTTTSPRHLDQRGLVQGPFPRRNRRGEQGLEHLVAPVLPFPQQTSKTAFPASQRSVLMMFLLVIVEFSRIHQVSFSPSPAPFSRPLSACAPKGASRAARTLCEISSKVIGLRKNSLIPIPLA